MRSPGRVTAERIQKRIQASAPQLLTGVVSAVNSATGTAAVTLDLGKANAPITAGAGILTGQTVRVLRTGKKLLVLGAANTPAFTPAPPLKLPTSGVQQFPALDSGTLAADNTWTTASTLAADNTHQGFWFHGRTLLDSLPDTQPATDVPVQVWVNPFTAGAVTFFLHPYFTRTTAAYSSGRTPRATVQVPGPGWVTLPAAWAATLLTAGGSIGIDSTGTVRGLGEDGQSGALRIAWTK